jgi:curli biogenesis system outer membrane secretion channel CsgG
VTIARVRASLLVLGGLLCFAYGCSNTGESASRDKLTANVGKYDPPPSIKGEKPRVGVPPFKVTTSGGIKNTNNLPTIAADQMTTLMDQTGRFDMIERAQVEQLLDEQNMEGIVRPDQMAKAGQVLGVDYLLIGKVTNFRVKSDQTKSGLNLGGIGGAVGGGRFGAGNSGFDQKKQNIKTECGVDIRLVDPTTGKVVASQFGEFTRTDSASALGISVLGIGANSDAEVSIEEDDAGKILRLAFDDALRKMLPKIDQAITSRPKTSGGSAPAAKAKVKASAAPAEEADTDAGAADATPPAKSAPANSAVESGATAGSKFCPECGTKVAANAKFCPKCGAKIQ